MYESLFTIVGLGEVSKEKPHGEYYASIFLKEYANLADAKVSEDEKVTDFIELFGGEKYQLNVTASSSIVAKWHSFGCGGNRITPPDLGVGETVLVVKYKGYDEYFWIKVFSEPDKRIQESVTFAFVAKSDKSENAEAEDYLSSSYRFTVDTVNKEIRLRTSKVNEEFCEYSFLIDTQDGKVILEDDLGNILRLDSQDDSFYLHANKDIIKRADNNGYVHLKKNSLVKVEGKETIYLKEGRDVHIEGTQTELVEKGFSVISGSTMSFRAKENFNLETDGKFGLKIVDKIEQKTMSDLVLQANQNIGITSSGGEVVIFAGAGITLFAPKIDLIAGAINAGAITCAALSVGGAAPTPPQIPMANPEGVQSKVGDDVKKNVEDAMKDLDERTKTPAEEEGDEEGSGSGGSGGSSGASASASRTSRTTPRGGSPWDNETKPQQPDTNPKSQDVVMDVKGKYSLSTVGTMEMTSNTTAKLSGKAGVAIEGTAGLTLKGANGDLLDNLYSIISSICTALDTPVPITSPAGPGTTVPVGQGAIISTTAQNLFTAFKGSAAGIALREKTLLDFADEEPIDEDKNPKLPGF